MVHRVGFTDEQLNELAKLGISEHLGLYIAPALLGFAFDSMLLGCIIQQLIWNLIWCPFDRRFNQFILFTSVVLAIANTMYNDAYLFHCFASGFGNWYRLVQLDWIRWYPILDSITVTVVQIFYLERAYRLHNRAKWVPLVVLPFILAALSGAIGSTITSSKIPDAYDLRITYPSFYTWLGASLVADILITSIILWDLVRSKTGWSETDLMINKLITISVETQLPSLIIALAFMICYAIKPGSAMNLFFELFHPKVHIVGLLTVLNSRNRLRKELNGPSVKENNFIPKPPGVHIRNSDDAHTNNAFEGSFQPTIILEDGIVVPELGSSVIVEPMIDITLLSSSAPKDIDREDDKDNNTNMMYTHNHPAEVTSLSRIPISVDAGGTTTLLMNKKGDASDQGISIELDDLCKRILQRKDDHGS
ncbi:uncharacterized protein I303_104799 [Kwoniella dejecticola CBS 10117]|uniref:DUF6534 domain-containing protein n=1 Tax=Kwoniella dejecticola CBS 10117 TaxID=1296121 RepID=A0A1A6A4D0_9TREE|nr:uncharacterized protein I303_04220 [Kwoniella dejecticola CBS 10117]OBR84898.1 hypothetical protein I303_04220 [Kwoniella dejecticola CBS 10117]